MRPCLRLALVPPLLALAALAAPPLARAERGPIEPDRPGAADGSSAVARGDVQLEVGFQREASDQGRLETRDLFLPTLVRVGVGHGVELRVETNAYSRTREESPAGAHSADGLSP